MKVPKPAAYSKDRGSEKPFKGQSNEKTGMICTDFEMANASVI